MTKQVQRRRGTATQHTSFTGAEGETSVNTTNKSIHVHDGTTTGGFEAARIDLTNVTGATVAGKVTGSTLSSLTITSADINGGTVDNVAIGNTTPSSGLFTTLNASSTLTLGGTAVTSTAAELNILDGVTATAAELNVLDGVTSTAAELNLVDGSAAGSVVINKAVIYSATGQVNATQLAIGGTAITSTAAELNILDGVTSTAAELNILDGVTATTAELNFVDGVTSNVQTQLNTKAPLASPAFTGGIDVTGTASADQLNSNNGKLFLDDNGSHDGVINAPASLFINFDSDNTSASEKIVFGYDRDGTSGGTSVMEINSSGIDVTGTVVADGLTVDGGSGSGTITLGSTTNVNGALTYDISGNTSIYLDNNYQSINSNFFYRSHAAGTPRNHLKIAGNGDISFYEDTGTTAKFYWDSSAEALGIGTSSPSSALTVGAGGTARFNRSDNATYNEIKYVTSGDLFYFNQANGGAYQFNISGVEKVSIDSSGKVEISSGSILFSSSDAGNLISNTAYVNIGQLYSSGGPYMGYGVKANTAVAGAYVSSTTIGIGRAAIDLGGTGGSGSFRVFTGPAQTTAVGSPADLTERMCIDSSGNLLVGKTSTSYAVEGIALRSDNAGVMSTVTDEACFTANRLNSDGTLILFAKDTATVGSIGTYDSDISIGSTTCGVSFYDTSNSVLPFNRTTNGYSDNAVNLGQSNVRFKNLYLSGGVYLGGTGSANKLDDYEEGTWTPVWSPATGAFSSVTYRFQNGVYTKIGNVVYISCQLSSDAITVDTGSGNIRIGGLPFTAVAVQNSSMAVGSANDFAGDFPNAANINPSSQILRLYYRTAVNGATSSLNVTDLSTATSYGNFIDLSGFYYTAA
jgi:hypothetical protein